MCPSTNRYGQPCGNLAGRSTNHPGWGLCSAHGGASPEGERNAEELRDLIAAEGATFEELVAGVARLRSLDHDRDGTVTGGQP